MVSHVHASALPDLRPGLGGLVLLGRSSAVVGTDRSPHSKLIVRVRFSPEKSSGQYCAGQVFAGSNGSIARR